MREKNTLFGDCIISKNGGKVCLTEEDQLKNENFF